MSTTRPAGKRTHMRRLLLVIALALLVLLVSGSIYGYYTRHGMRPVAEREIGSPTAPRRVLIATQGSLFKDRLVTSLVARVQGPDTYVRVIDIDTLGKLDAGDWQAIVLVHTWEFGNPPAAASDLVAAAADPRRILAVTTSGMGRQKLPGVDAISSASVVDDVPALVYELGARIDALLAPP